MSVATRPGPMRLKRVLTAALQDALCDLHPRQLPRLLGDVIDYGTTVSVHYHTQHGWVYAVSTDSLDYSEWAPLTLDDLQPSARKMLSCTAVSWATKRAAETGRLLLGDAVPSDTLD